MSKVKEILEALPSLSQIDLQLILDNVKPILRPKGVVQVREVYKTCGKPNCTCSFGPSSEYGHGPYLYASWKGWEGKRKQVSLGKPLSDQAIDQLRDLPQPVWYDFKISEKQKDRMSESQQWYVTERTLTESEFLDLYGLSRREDTLNRDFELLYDYKSFDLANEKWTEMQDILSSHFCHLFSIINPQKIKLLNFLFENNFTIIDNT